MPGHGWAVQRCGMAATIGKAGACTCSTSASSYFAWSQYVDARLFMLLKLSGFSGPSILFRTSSTV
jgi:hypothetical protein